MISQETCLVLVHTQTYVEIGGVLCELNVNLFTLFSHA